MSALRHHRNEQHFTDYSRARQKVHWGLLNVTDKYTSVIIFLKASRGFQLYRKYILTVAET
jgi:hypothetical protein